MENAPWGEGSLTPQQLEAVSQQVEVYRAMLPVFEANLRQFFPDLDQLPHADTLARLLARIEAMRGYHYLMRLGHALNVLARYSAGLAKYVRDLGVRGVIAFVRQTLADPWLKVEELQRIAATPCQIRLE